MLIKGRRQVRGQRRLRPIKASKQGEVVYRDLLTALVEKLVQIASDEINSATLNDSVSGDGKLLAKANKAIDKLVTFDITPTAREIAARMVSSVNRTNKINLASRFKAAYQLDITDLLSDKVVYESLNKALEHNVGLISSLKNDFVSDLGNAIRKNYVDGMRSTELIKLIHERGDVTESHAKLIARDQTSKINGQITRERNDSLGIEMYIWLGAGDERERDSHRAMNGLLCNFKDSTVYSDDDGVTWKKRAADMVKLHPCEDYNCRCDYQPYIKWQ